MLNVKKELYCQLVVKGYSKTEAYIQAFKRTRNNRHVSQMVWDLHKSPIIVDRINQLLELADRGIAIELKEWKDEVKRLAYLNIGNVLKVNSNNEVVLKDIDNIDYSIVQNIENQYDKDGIVNGYKVRFHDKIKALEQLGKHLGAFTEKIEIHDKTGQDEIIAWKRRKEIIESGKKNEIIEDKVVRIKRTTHRPAAGANSPSCGEREKNNQDSHTDPLHSPAPGGSSGQAND